MPTITPTVTLGIGLGDRFSPWCELDKGGSVVDEGRVATSPAAFRVRFGGAVRARIALEVGTHPPWVSKRLKETGHEVLATNARNAPRSSRATRRTTRWTCDSWRAWRAWIRRSCTRSNTAVERRGSISRWCARACLVTERTR